MFLSSGYLARTVIWVCKWGSEAGGQVTEHDCEVLVTEGNGLLLLAGVNPQACAFCPSERPEKHGVKVLEWRSLILRGGPE